MSFLPPIENYTLNLRNITIPKLTGTRQAIINGIKRQYPKYKDMDFSLIGYDIKRYEKDPDYYQFIPVVDDWSELDVTKDELTFIHHKDKLPDLGKLWDSFHIPPVIDGKTANVEFYDSRLFDGLGLDRAQQVKGSMNITLFCTTKNLSMIGKTIPEGFYQQARDTYSANEIQLGRYYDSHLDDVELKAYADKAVKAVGNLSGSPRRLYNSMIANQAKGRIIMIYSEN